MPALLTSIVPLALTLMLVGSQAPVTAGGRLVFVGTYTRGASEGIYAFRFDDAAGTFRPLGLAAALANPSFLTVSADGRVLFAVSEVTDYDGGQTGAVASFAIDRERGTLTPLSIQPSRGTNPCHLALDATGRFLAVANYSSGTVALFPVTEDGRIEPATTVLTHEGAGPNRTRQTGPHAHQVVFDPANRYLLAVDLGVDRIFVYRFDAAAGTLTPAVPPAAQAAPGAGPRHLTFAPDRPLVFAIEELQSTISTWAWEPDGGHLTPRGRVTTLPSEWSGTNGSAEIAIHPNGHVLYGSNRGHDSLAIFDVATDGTVTLVGHERTGGRTPRFFTLTPGGQWLVAANQDSDDLTVFRVDETTGALTRSGPTTTVGSPVCLVFVPPAP